MILVWTLLGTALMGKVGHQILKTHVKKLFQKKENGYQLIMVL